MNLPNGDMVGHTGDVEATVVACKAADEAVKVSFLPGFCHMSLFDLLFRFKCQSFCSYKSLTQV